MAVNVPTAANTAGAARGDKAFGNPTLRGRANIKVAKGRSQRFGRAGGRGRGGRGRGGAPNPLAPLSGRQIRRQAGRNVNAAYAGAYQDLNQQGRQASAINDKRAADNKYYQSWLDAHMAQLQSHADAARESMNAFDQQLNNEQNQLDAQQGPGMVNAANSNPGNVSNNATSIPLTADLAGNQDAQKGLLTSALRQANQSGGTASDTLSSTRANNFAAIQDARRSQIGDFNKVMMQIANSRAKLNTNRIGDLEKEIQRLQGIELQKAQSNRDFGIAAQKLGVQTANTASEINARTQNANTASGRLNEQKLNDWRRQRNADRTYQLNKEKFGFQKANTIYNRTHARPSSARGGRGAAGAAGQPGVGNGPGQLPRGVKAATEAHEETIFSHIDQIAGQLNHLIHTLHMTPQKAYHTLQNGGIVYSTDPNTGKTHPHTVSPVDIQLLNAAFNVRNGGVGLTPGDVAALRQRGIEANETHTRYNFSTDSHRGRGRRGAGRTTR